MEAQQTNSNISLLSSMNAFYGIPNTSQETAAAIDRGVPAPEVYSPGSREPIVPEQTPETATNPAPTTPAETYFSQATEQLEISDQAVAMQLQQQQQENNNPAIPVAADNGTPAPEAQGTDIEPQLQVEPGSNNSGQRVEQNMAPNQPQPNTATEPTAVTGLNDGPMTQTQNTGRENSQQPANSLLQTSYAQFSGSGPAASSASQPGNRLSAMG